MFFNEFSLLFDYIFDDSSKIVAILNKNHLQNKIFIMNLNYEQKYIYAYLRKTYNISNVNSK